MDDEKNFAEFLFGLMVLKGVADFLPMFGTYDERLVGNYTSDDQRFAVDTCAVTDTPYPFETALRHPSYNNGEWVIVETYDSLNSAKAGHDKWVDLLLSDNLPYTLVDVSDNLFVTLMDVVKGDSWRDSKRNAWIDETSEESEWDLTGDDDDDDYYD